jgi:hypothetical protein
VLIKQWAAAQLGELPAHEKDFNIATSLHSSLDGFAKTALHGISQSATLSVPPLDGNTDIP